MSNKNVYLAVASYGRDGSGTIKGFTTEQAALDFCEKCRKYELDRRPPPPLVKYDAEKEEIAASDKLWDEYFEWEDAFNASHPAGHDGNADDYVVETITMVTA